MRLLLTLLLTATACAAQSYTHRGFLDNRGTFYAQTTPRDRARAVGETLLRYEGFYKPSGALQLAGAVDLRIDTHHQVSRELKVSWRDREIQRPLAAIRRLSAAYHNGPLTFEAGKQFVRWGKTDIVTPTDRFAPRDFLTVVDNEFLSITAARLTFEKGPNTVEAVWSPYLTPSRVPLPDQRWGVTAELPAGVTPGNVDVRFPGGPQAGLRWNRTGAIEYELSLYQGFNHLPSFTARQRPTIDGFQIDIEQFYPRMIMAGAAVAAPTPLFTLKGEAGYFSSQDDRADEYAIYVVQLERQSGEWLFVGGYAGEVVTGEGSRSGTFAPDRGLTRTLLGRAGYNIDANRSLAFEAAVRNNGDGLWIKSEYSQALGQHWRATAVGTLIRGAATDFLGQYRRNSNVTVVLRYSF